MDVTIYTKNYCKFSKMAKSKLEQLGIPYDEIDVTNDNEKFQEMLALSGRKTVPQIFINDTHVGGYDDLINLIQDPNWQNNFSDNLL